MCAQRRHDIDQPIAEILIDHASQRSGHAGRVKSGGNANTFRRGSSFRKASANAAQS